MTFTRVFGSIALALGCSFVLFSALAAFSQDTSPLDKLEPGRTYEVTLTDGRTLTGTVEKTETGLKVKTRYATLELEASSVKSLKPVLRAEDAYIVKRKDINTSDPEDLYRLALWVWENHSDNLEMLQRAKADLEGAIGLKEDYARAKILQRQVEAKIKSLETSTTPGGSDPVDRRTIGEGKLVNERDIFWLRLMELRDDERAYGRFEGDTLQNYIDTMRGSNVDNWDNPNKEQQFKAWPFYRQVQEILDNTPVTNTSLLSGILIRRDPQFMIEFRSRIWPMVKAYCAGEQCHGGPTPRGGLKFITELGPDRDSVDYTNFAILVGWNRNGRRLVDRGKYEESLLLQYGMNTKAAKIEHPTKIQPMFQDKNSRRYRQIMDWMKKLRGPIYPNYHLQYSPPWDMPLDLSGKANADILGTPTE